MTLLRFDGFELDVDGGVLRRAGGRVSLSPLTLRLLVHLARNPARLMSTDELLREVWPGVHVTESSVHQAIRSLRKALAPHAAVVETVRGLGYRFAAHTLAAPDRVAVDPLVGREGPLARLDASIEAARSGRGGLVLVTGEPGIGRSRFLREGVDRARAAGARAILVRCGGFTSGVPLWPWHELLAELGSASYPTRREATRTGELKPRGFHRREFEWTRRAVLESAREGPLCLFLDDLDRGHAASWAMLEGLAGAADDSLLLLVVASRDECAAAAPERTAAIARLLRAPRVRREPLAPLTRAEVRSVAAAALGREPSARRSRELHARSGGNPFLLHTLLDGLGERRGQTGLEDPRIRGAVAAHLGIVDRTAREWLRRASALGLEFDAALLASIFERPPVEVRAALAPSQVVGILRAGASDRSLRFSHGLLAEAARAELPSDERERLRAFASAASPAPLRSRDPAGSTPVEIFSERSARHHRRQGMLGGSGSRVRRIAPSG